MKKLIQISLVVVLIFVLLQAVVGLTSGSPDKTAPVGSGQYATAATSEQSLSVLTCSSSRPVNCAVPLVGWNS